MTNTLPKEFTDYCTKNNLPDTIGVYALWKAWQDALKEIELLEYVACKNRIYS